MKNFIIISTAITLVAAIFFGFSVFYYVDKTSVEEPTTAPTEIEAPMPTLGNIDDPTPPATPMPSKWQDNGIFSKYYDQAYSYVSTMSSEQLVGQLLIATCPTTEDTAKTNLNKYNLSGYVYTVDNFYAKSKDEIKSLISSHKSDAKIPLICAVKEEGGAHTTLSDLDAFPEYNFTSPRTTFETGGMDAIKEDEIKKAEMLKSVGVDLNLAPVCDMAQEYNQIMYSRSLGGTLEQTCEYARTVTTTNQQKGISVALKHFPGYGTIPDTLDSVVVDTRELSVFEQNDFKPFEAGANAGAHCIMMSNVLVQSLDSTCISSLSKYTHKVLRDVIGYTGLIITDNLDKADYSQYSDGKDVYVQAVLAGNNLLLVDNVEQAYTSILNAVKDGTIDLDTLQHAVTRVLAYKYAVGIIK